MTLAPGGVMLCTSCSYGLWLWGVVWVWCCVLCAVVMCGCYGCLHVACGCVGLPEFGFALS